MKENVDRGVIDDSNDLVRAISSPLLNELTNSGKNINILNDLCRIRRKIKNRLNAADDDSLRLELIQKFNADFPKEKNKNTAGELCDELIRLSLELDEAIMLQNDATVSDEIRKKRLDDTDRIQAERAHLKTCLKLVMGGKTELPPFEYKSSQNPYFNPNATKIIPDKLKPETNHILALACTGHGASLTYLGKDGTIRSSVFDRWAGTKYTFLLSKGEIKTLLEPETKLAAAMRDLLEFSYGRFPRHREFETDFSKWLEWLLKGLDITAEDIDLFVSGDSLFVTSAYSLGQEMNKWFPNASIIMDVEHHKIHQCQAFWQSGFDEAAVVTIDTCGEDLARLNGRKIAGTITIKDRNGREEVLREFIFPSSSAGLIYAVANHHIGYSQGQEGKTMGLAPYGKPDLYNELVKSLRLYPDGSFDFISNQELHKIFEEYEPERPRTKGAEFTQRHKNVAYAAQTLIEDILSNTFKAALRLSGLNTLVYAGGVALNSVANEVARNIARPERIYISPNPSDTGQALGFALYGAYELAGWTPPDSELTEYLGPPYTGDEIAQAAHSTKYHAIRSDNPVNILARCVANGHICARFSGSAEFGPRALGNRSIVADPRRHDMKDYLNSRVKHREGFRPFAPSVLIEHVSEWFDMTGRSPHMLRVVNVPGHLRDKIPGIVHVDGTARVQTVDKTENEGYWNLIHTFYELTGVPVVLNTSFNVGGKPIVETPQDAINCFESTNIDVLMLEDWIISKRPLNEFTDMSR